MRIFPQIVVKVLGVFINVRTTKHILCTFVPEDLRLWRNVLYLSKYNTYLHKYDTVQYKLNHILVKKNGQNPVKEKQSGTKGRTELNQIPIFPLK
jgi:hypothetical protein